MKINGPVFTYQSFSQWMAVLVAAGRTSGPRQSEELAAFTALNLKRMERLDKTLKLDDSLAGLLKRIVPQDWLVLTEAWCGDSAQSLPVIGRLAAMAQGRVSLKIALRDENPDLMDRFLTNGGRSIPKLVAFDRQGNELFNWGPRPAEAQQIMLDWKASPNGRDWHDFEKELHLWYAKDKTISIQKELNNLLSAN